MILEREYSKSVIYENIKNFQKNNLFHPKMILRHLFRFKDTKKIQVYWYLTLCNKEIIFNFLVNHDWKKLTDSLKRAKILANNRKSHHPIETLLSGLRHWLRSEGKKWKPNSQVKSVQT